MQNFVGRGGGGATADSRARSRRRQLTISVCKSTVFIVGGGGAASDSEYWKAENEPTKGLNLIPAKVGGSRRFDYIVT